MEKQYNPENKTVSCFPLTVAQSLWPSGNKKKNMGVAHSHLREMQSHVSQGLFSKLFISLYFEFILHAHFYIQFMLHTSTVTGNLCVTGGQCKPCCFQ